MCEWSSLCSWLWLVALEDSQVLTGDKGKREISKDISNFWQPFQTKYQNKNTFWLQATGGGGLFLSLFFDYSHFVFAAVEISISPQFKIYILAEIHLLFCHRRKQDKGGRFFCMKSSGIGCTFGNFPAEGLYQMCFRWLAPGIVLMDISPVLSVI